MSTTDTVIQSQRFLRSRRRSRRRGWGASNSPAKSESTSGGLENAPPTSPGEGGFTSGGWFGKAKAKTNDDTTMAETKLNNPATASALDKAKTGFAGASNKAKESVEAAKAKLNDPETKETLSNAKDKVGEAAANIAPAIAEGAAIGFTSGAIQAAMNNHFNKKEEEKEISAEIENAEEGTVEMANLVARLAIVEEEMKEAKEQLDKSEKTETELRRAELIKELAALDN